MERLESFIGRLSSESSPRKVEKKTGGLRWIAYFSTTPFSSRSDGQIKFKLEREEADLCESGRELVRLLSEADFDAV